MNKILKTMLPIVGVACVATPLVTMTSCNKHESKIEECTKYIDFSSFSEIISATGFKIKNADLTKYSYNISKTPEWKGNCSKNIRNILADSPYHVSVNQDTVEISCGIKGKVEKIVEGDFFSISFTLQCEEIATGVVLWRSAEILKAVHKSWK